jgi:hypothetical protein
MAKDRPTTQTVVEVDDRLYKLLFELDRRLDEKFKDARIQNKEDIKAATELAIAPIYGRLDNIDSRLNEGNRRFTEQDARADEHSDKIENALELVRQYRTVKQSKESDGTTTVTKKKAMPWWLPLLIGGALAFVGERAAKFVLNGLADPPPSVVTKP